MARATTTSDVFNAIAEPQRRSILELLRAGDRASGEVADALGLNPAAASKHLRVLHEVGLVQARPDAQRRIYHLESTGLREIHEWVGGFEEFWNDSFDRLDAYVRRLNATEEDNDG
jgi:DNA-binding transcriptional ArsR family regulator